MNFYGCTTTSGGPEEGLIKITICEQQVETVHSSEILFTRTTSNINSSNEAALMPVRLNVRLLKKGNIAGNAAVDVAELLDH